MNPPYLLAASILSADFTQLGQQIAQAEQAGADWIHVDVMDGHFVPNLTMGPFIVKACRKATSLPLDVHLMVENPDQFLEAFAQAGATNLSVHVETCPNLHRTLQAIHELGCKAGVVLNPATPVSLIETVLPMIDLVLVMSVDPGYSGQAFLPEVLPKLVNLDEILRRVNPTAYLEIDGGINADTLPLALKAGANVFVAAHAIFDYPTGIAAGIQRLRTQFQS
ncbi:MAG: ribulose-phosphate 3-epimerase [Anaerolineales bacterium]|nr:ribulose-phosphate 3-epimerase [Anaerolineae bacterium]PWB52205.1 MAG: ribulose-phosphate 3-epimerase [Anaerolineales bacterium]